MALEIRNKLYRRKFPSGYYAELFKDGKRVMASTLKECEAYKVFLEDILIKEGQHDYSTIR